VSIVLYIIKSDIHNIAIPLTTDILCCDNDIIIPPSPRLGFVFSFVFSSVWMDPFKGNCWWSHQVSELCGIITCHMCLLSPLSVKKKRLKYVQWLILGSIFLSSIMKALQPPATPDLYKPSLITNSKPAYWSVSRRNSRYLISYCLQGGGKNKPILDLQMSTLEKMWGQKQYACASFIPHSKASLCPNLGILL